MDGIFKVAAALGLGGFGLGAMEVSDLSSINLDSIDLDSLKQNASQLKELLQQLQREHGGDILKALRELNKG